MMKPFENLSLEFLTDYVHQIAQHGQDPYNRIGLNSGVENWTVLNNWFDINIVPGSVK
jgi:hypothetical protein